MVNLFGKEYSREELLQRVGDISQIGGVTAHELSDGVERGVRAFDFRTGSGFDFTVLADRGLDISGARFNGQPLNWRSPVKDVSPAYYEEPGLKWLKSFYGGLVVTCGLTYAGAPCTDEGKELGLHGRYSNIPASNCYCDGMWEDDEYVMWVEGKVREATVFGENLELGRVITAKLGEPRLWIVDEVTNLGYKETPHMILYHCNFGFPVIDGGSRLIAPVKSYRPRDAASEPEKEKYAEFESPIAGFSEKVYYLDLAEDEDGLVTVALVNKGFNGGQGFGAYVKFIKEQLPKFIEWKFTGQQTYVVGLEPANCWVEGRDKERERGTLQTLKPGETREYHLEIGVLRNNDEIAALEEEVKSVLK